MDFQSAKSFGKLRLRAFQPYYLYYIYRHCRYKTRMSNVFNAIYVDTVNTKHIHTFLLITFLIFNGFSIHKKFWKAETQGFSTILSILYILTLSIQNKESLMHSMLSMSTLSIQNTSTHSCFFITFLIFNGFSIRKKFWKAETQGFSTILSILYILTLSIQNKDV